MYKNLKDVPFIFLAARNIQKEKIKLLRKGAVDYISRPFSIEELPARIDSIIKAQESVKEKNILLFGSKVYKMLERMADENNGSKSKENQDLVNNLYYEYKIPGKEVKVISLLKAGLEYKEIAHKLDITTNTVKTHISRIYNKCNVNNKIELLQRLNSI